MEWASIHECHCRSCRVSRWSSDLLGIMCGMERQPTLMTAIHCATEFTGMERRQEVEESIVQKARGAIAGYTNGVGFFTQTVTDPNRS